MRAPSILVLAISVTLCAGCGKPKVWTPFTTPDGKVSVVFPSAPKQQNSSSGGLNLNNYVCEFRNEAYLFSQTDLPPGAAFDSQAGLNAMAAKFNGKIISQSPITVNGQTGTAYEMEVKTPAIGFATGRMFKVKDRLYQLMALGTNCRASNPDVAKFLGALDLSKVK
jgi:hypothetical protein